MPRRRAASTSLPPGYHDRVDELRRAVAYLSRRLLRQGPNSVPATLAIVLHGIRGPAPTVGEIARFERISLTTVSRAITQLERLGLVRRRPDPADARVTRVALTAKGARERSRQFDSRDEWWQTRLALLDPEELSLIMQAAPALSRLCDLDRGFEEGEVPGPGGNRLAGGKG